MPNVSILSNIGPNFMVALASVSLADPLNTPCPATPPRRGIVGVHVMVVFASVPVNVIVPVLVPVPVIVPVPVPVNVIVSQQSFTYLPP